MIERDSLFIIYFLRAVVSFLCPGFESPHHVSKRSRTGQATPPSSPAETTDRACSPHAEVKPKTTPEEDKHRFFNLRADRVESLLMRVRRPRNDDIQMSTRTKTLSVVKRKLMNQLRVPTRSNPSFHLYREIELMHPNAAKSIFWDLQRSGPFLRGNSVYYNWETDDNETMRQWFALHERRAAGIGHGILRSHGQVFVMARPPFLAEHQSNEEAEGVRITCGIMTLNSRGGVRFAPPPDPEMDTPEAAKERRERAEVDTKMAWTLVKSLAERGSCDLCRNWYYSLAERFGSEWLSYLTEAIDTTDDDEDPPEVNSDEEAA